MGEIAIGALALIFLIVLLRLYVGANPKALVKLLRYLGAALLGALAVFLFFTERVGPAIFVASAAYGLFTKGHIWPGGWPHYQFPWGGGGSHPKAGQATGVSTDWLDMTLDHDTGEMHGRILKGGLAGRDLDNLSRNEALALYREAGADPESARLIEAWLERRFPDWREDFQQKPAAASYGMTRQEALRVLGLEEGATPDEIRAAHKKLMMQMHPDRGGSDYLASKINEAKDVLLG
jgi:hypothetical protein